MLSLVVEMNRIAHDCGSKSGAFAWSFGRWQT